MMIDTLSMHIFMFSIFGLAVWMNQQGHGRRLIHPDDLSSTDPSAALFVAASGGAGSPAGFTAQEAAEDTHEPNVPPNPFVEPDQAGDYESWCFKTELRFAAETVLVAYLPTAMLRIIILSLLPESPSHPFLEMMERGINWPMLLMIGIMAVVVAPVVEELLYRVTILGGFMHQNATVVGWIVSSVLFSFAHGFPDSVALLPLAFAIGYAYIRRRSYRTVMLIHFLFNAFNMVIAGISLV